MKLCLLLLISNLFIICHSGERDKEAISVQKVITDTVLADSLNEPISFINQIQPILVKNCNPCHFPGGKMYAKLPFDDPKTILEHEAGVLKRIKEKDEVALIKKFIEENEQ